MNMLWCIILVYKLDVYTLVSNHSMLNRRRAYAAWVTVYTWFVGVFVCLYAQRDIKNSDTTGFI